MGYKLTTNPVKRQLHLLEQLAASRETLSIPTTNPRRLAYKIREAIAAAGEHSQYETLHSSISGRFKFREVTGAVIADCVEPDLPTIGMPIGEPSPSLPPARPEKKTLPDAATLIEVLAGALKFPDESELFFPGISLKTTERLKLYNWAEPKGWKYIDHSAGDGEGGLTLTKREVAEEILWTPEEDS